jgi:excinuclease ABC subunit B
LIQTIGRAARNSEGKVIMYADKMTDSMEKAISETKRRREIQEEYNEKHGVTPTTIQKEIRDAIKATREVEETEEMDGGRTNVSKLSKPERQKLIASLEGEMKEAAKALDFERAAQLRDTILELKAEG